MNKVLPTIQEIQRELNTLSETKTLAQAQRVILSVVRLLDDSVSLDDSKSFQLFNVDNQKISANAQWFFEDNVVVDRRAIYKIHSENSLNIDFKLYGITKPSKRTISWVQALTPNFEDEPFNSKFNVGIDFVVPKSVDKVIIVLSNNYVVRTLELKGTLTATFQEILAKWASISDFSNKKEAHSILWESFDLQPLNKKFYAGISERFITLRQYLTKENILDDKHASLFANRLLGRVIFCWFLDKKGVINPDRKYFNSHSFTDDSEYYRKNLENLFFGVLNTPIADREYKDDVTPFLNGGLFEARDTDLYKNSKLSFPKNYFDDLFHFLSSYNFTTDESTSQFQQVAIDPEMLGRIFENLLAEMTEENGGQARKAKGAFYTPREIVDYMCRESLREYLKTKIPEDQYRDQRFAQLIDAPDKDFQDQDHNWRRDWKPYKDGIIKALDDLKVLDPACGSGAFPIGMLQLLVRVYERLEPRFDTYKAKLQIVEKNIYGVDIEPMAVEIARLRAWLSIIVDEEADSKKIKPLPNLEFKFVCANSLANLDQSGITTFGDDPKLAEKLQEIRDSYFNTESLNKKRKLRSDYEALVNKGEGLFGESLRSKQLKTYRPFDNEWTSNFFDPNFIFGVKKFNIIIGNPPYLEARHSNFSDSLKEVIQKSAKDRWGIDSEKITRGADLLIYFYEFGIFNLTDKGHLVLIVQNSWLDTDYGKKFQQFLLKHTNVRKIIDSDLKHFDSSSGPNINTVITVFEGSKPSTDSQDVVFAKLYTPEATQDNSVSGGFAYKELHRFRSDDELLNRVKWGVILTSSPKALKWIELLQNKGRLITDVGGSIGQGLNLTKDYIVETETVKDLELPEEALIPFMTTLDGAPFELTKTENFLIDQSKISSEIKRELDNRGIRSFDPKSTKRVKADLILPRGVSRHFCATNKISAYTSSAVEIYISEEYILNLWCFLNSSLGWFVREVTGRKNLGGGLLKAEATDLNSLPIYFDFDCDSKIQTIFNKIRSRQVLTRLDELDIDSHKELDAIVAEHLGISDIEFEEVVSELKAIITRRYAKSKT